MDLLFNDLSLHGQFPDLSTFEAAVDRIMGMRKLTARFGRELYCHRNVANGRVTSGMAVPQAVRAFEPNRRRALMAWLTRHGPFWEDARQHGGEDYLECFQYEGEVVTDTAVGEAAYCCLHGRDRGLVSMDPSDWLFSPAPVDWHPEDGGVRRVDVRNYWDADLLAAELEKAPPPLGSWSDLEATARTRCPDLVFAPDGFKPLDGHPFSRGVAERLLDRIVVLQQLRGCFDDHGERTPEGHKLYRKHFTGDKAWFSDSSSTEKREFRTGLTFPNPSAPGAFLFCPWHGKVKTPQLRIHFSWPVRADEPLHVVYVGPKITKR